PAVGAAGGGVEVVDVEADDGGDVGEGVAQDGGHAGGGHPGAPVLGGDPDALDLAGAVGRGTDLGFEDHFAVGVEPGEGTSRPDEFGDPGLVEQAAVAGQRGDADLLGEHGDAGRHDRFHLVLADAPDVGVRGDVLGRAVGDHERLVGADLPGGAPLGFQQPPQLGGGAGRADDGGAAAAGPPGPVGEGAHGPGGGADGDQVGARVAQGGQ